jgi:hypothetical protein
VDVAVTRPFGEQLLLDVAGPLIAAVLGTFIFGYWLQRLADRAQMRRELQQREEDQRQEDHRRREDLIGDMTRAASTLYFETQRYWRGKRDRADTLDRLRKELDACYHQCRIDGEVLESRLEAHFRTSQPMLAWHAVQDLLTVRYYYLLDLMTKSLLDANAVTEVSSPTRLSEEVSPHSHMEPHSGLSSSELQDPKRLLEQYHRKLHEATQLVLSGDLRSIGAGRT